MTEEFDLSAAYAVETPDDNRKLYANWATTYDSDFVATHGYVYHESVVAAFLRRTGPDGPIVDVGCGTGVVGIELRRQGVSVVDGIDLSPEMLAVASTKTTDAGDAVYRQLIPVDLTEPTTIGLGAYAGLVSAGTFTHGHLGPEPIAQLIGMAMPGAVLALGINENHFEAAGFGRWFERELSVGTIADLEIVESPIYDPERYTADDAESHASDKSAVALFTAA